MVFDFGSTFRSHDLRDLVPLLGRGAQADRAPGGGPHAVVDDLDAGRLLVEEHAVVLVREDEDVEPPLLEVLLVVDRQRPVLGEGARRAEAESERKDRDGPHREDRRAGSSAPASPTQCLVMLLSVRGSAPCDARSPGGRRRARAGSRSFGAWPRRARQRPPESCAIPALPASRRGRAAEGDQGPGRRWDSGPTPSAERGRVTATPSRPQNRPRRGPPMGWEGRAHGRVRARVSRFRARPPGAETTGPPLGRGALAGSTRCPRALGGSEVASGSSLSAVPTSCSIPQGDAVGRHGQA